MSDLTTPERVTLLQTIVTSLRMLGEDGAVAGLILEHDAYDNFRRYFGDECKAYDVNGIILDPKQDNTCVVAGMLILRGTQ